MGVFTVVSKKREIIELPFKSPNDEVRISNANIRVAQINYTSDQI